MAKKIKNVALNSITNNKIVSIDLQSDPDYRTEARAAEYSINAKLKRFPLIGNRDNIQGTIHVSVDLKDKSILEKLVINENRPLFKVKHHDAYGPSIDFRMKSISENVEVYFEQSAILDYKEAQNNNDTLMIKYVLTWSKDNNKEVQQQEDSVTIKFNRIQPTPHIAPTNDIEIPYTTEGTRTNHTLSFSNNCQLLRAPWLKMKIDNVALMRDHTIIPNAVSLLYDKATANRSYYPSNYNVMPAERQNGASMKSDGTLNSLFGHPDYHIDVPIKFDLSNIRNPIESYDTYKLHIDYTFRTEDINNDSKGGVDIPVKVLKDEVLTELGVDYGTVMGNIYRRIEEIRNDSVASSSSVVDINRNMVFRYSVCIRNKATVIQTETPNAAVLIKNFNIKGLVIPDGYKACSENNKEISVNDFCKLSPLSFVRKQSDTIKLRPNEQTCFEVIFDPNDNAKTIKYFLDNQGKRQYSFDASVIVEFDYLEDCDGTGNGSFSHFKAELLFPISVAPSDEWLGLDFGTSAVVGLYGNAYDDQGNRRDCIQNLEAIKRAGLRQAFPNNDPRNKVTDETIFINSNIVVNDDTNQNQDNVKDFKHYSSAKIFFSPGDQFNYNYLLPSLKSMMGYDILPRVLRSDVSTVDSVYEMAYKQLFSLYISKLNTSPIEKIVMTYPNTFAPTHIRKLKGMAKQCLGSLRDDYIVCISESDAVAFQYLSVRERLLNGNSDVDGNVLIYDMGAGTLDITYFSNRVEDECRVIEIKGKMGLNKAGNYIDYVLTQIIVSLCDEHNITDVNGESLKKYILLENAQTTDISERSKLKRYVKNSVKPILSEASDTKLPSIDGYENVDNLTVSDVTSHPLFESLMAEISTDVLENCANLFGEFGTLPVDVVIFSGRMTSLGMIRDKVVESLKTLGNHAVIALEISDGITNTCHSQSLKTAVVNGALAYVEKYWRKGDILSNNFRLIKPRPFYATYYVMLRLNNGTLRPTCIVNSNDTDQYDAVETVDLSTVSDLYLVQTYAAGDKMVSDFEGDRDYTTILDKQSGSNYNGRMDVGVHVDKETLEVYLMIGTGYRKQYAHDNIKSMAFKKSAWPIIF